MNELEHPEHGTCVECGKPVGLYANTCVECWRKWPLPTTRDQIDLDDDAEADHHAALDDEHDRKDYYHD